MKIKDDIRDSHAPCKFCLAVPATPCALWCPAAQPSAGSVEPPPDRSVPSSRPPPGDAR